MRGEIGGEDQGSEGGDGENVKGERIVHPCLLPISAKLKQYNLHYAVDYLPIM